jgi:2-isopropylmalate synthase
MSETPTAAERVKVFDTTLRDGNQTPHATFNAGDKVAIAMRLADMGVDIIEAGFPGSEDGDFEAVHEVAKTVGSRVVVSAFSRSMLSDVEAAGEAVQPALLHSNARVHTGIGTSPIHMEQKLHKTPGEVLEEIRLSVARAKEFTPDVQFYAEDATRSDPQFLLRALKEAVEAGATSVMIPDTVGIATPPHYAGLMVAVRKGLDTTFGPGTVEIAAHCHDDLGNATNNTLAAVAAGVDEIQVVSGGGLGERGGNTRLETVVMNLRLRPEEYGGRDTNIRTQMLTGVANEVMERAGLSLAPGAPIVGDNAFKHESGIHQDGVSKATAVYEPYSAELAGQETSFSDGSQSGKSAARRRLEHLAIEDVNGKILKEVSTRLKRLADEEGRNYVDSDVEQIYAEVTSEALVDYLELEDWKVSKAKGKPSTAVVAISGLQQAVESKGGELDAVAKGINELTGLDGEIKSWKLAANRPKDHDADVGVFAIIAHNGRDVEVYAHSQSTLEATVEAYEKGLNMLHRVETRATAA